MDSGTTARPAGSASPPSLPQAALDAINAPRPADAPRRCFICLTDEDPSDPPGSWVDPCPCTLEAHQDCMLSWVTDCERSNKPLQCPVCKSTIQMEGPWDPVVAVADAAQRRFTRASPFMLFTSVSLGVQFSSQMYGAMALWMFAGRDALLEFMLGPDMVIDGRASRGLKFARVGNAAILMHVAPALLLGQLLPGLGNKIFVPTASLYGIYHVLHDENFVSWPPSPQLALAVFPYIRSIYYNLWREFVFPYELSLNRQLLGLPPNERRQNGAGPRRENRRDAERNAERNVERNGEGGLVNFLQNLLDALDPDDEENGGGNAANLRLGQEDVQPADRNQDGDVMFELVIEEGAVDNGADVGLEVEVEEMAADQGEAAQPEPQAGEAPAQPPPPAQDQAGPEAQAPVDQGAQEQDQVGPDNRHEAPAAPAHRPGLGTILSNVSNALVSALILPGVSFAMGEALRLMLPGSWTSMPRSPRPRLGLLQQQWGRSLVGGCMYVVIKDAVRLYAKHRKVAGMASRRVRNVDRPRRNNRSSG